jgi:hydrogenase assembly chaperone HypC/HupF
MCLSDVGRVVAVDEVRRTATVEIGRRAMEVSTVTLGLDGPPVETGAWLIVHTGLAVERVSDDEARRILGARAELAGTGSERSEGHETHDREGRP